MMFDHFHNHVNIKTKQGKMGKKPDPKPPKQQKKPKPKPQSSKPKHQQPSASEEPAPALPLPLQQCLLTTFNTAFSPVLISDSFQALLQEVKAALYARDFEAAFAQARPESLDAYAARWSPTRALGYASILLDIGEHLAEDVCRPVSDADGANSGGDADSEDAASAGDAQRHIKMVSIGGGAAEIVAFAAYLSPNPSVKGSITLLDSAPWSSVITKLHDALTTPPPLSKYASAAAKASNTALIPQSHLSSAFAQQDVLNMSREQLSETLGKDALLVTLLFTLNELYTLAGIGKTTTFLLNLTATIPSGSLLLVVDSPGSYSETAVGKESKKYPMQWLLDHTLIKDEPVEGCQWEKLESHDSIWFRLDDSLTYPIPLENMRYQMHLYRATRP
ncbi:25S rRNA (uridine(2843)-N(3))-methyltransferase [Colletotrichum truncatum]|uniref:25S rRNA (Uridine(2843)-N(3))-methyltransferase n=1 Tax=Colletotrichum truncatum TaxID=5467 RepID=A0ACC3ZF66_COLTU